MTQINKDKRNSFRIILDSYYYFSVMGNLAWRDNSIINYIQN